MIKEFVYVSILFRNSARATRDNGGMDSMVVNIDLEKQVIMPPYTTLCDGA